MDINKDLPHDLPFHSCRGSKPVDRYNFRHYRISLKLINTRMLRLLDFEKARRVVVPDRPFTAMRLENLSHDVSGLHKTCRSPDR